jgi:hypothetical protein
MPPPVPRLMEAKSVMSLVSLMSLMDSWASLGMSIFMYTLIFCLLESRTFSCQDNDFFFTKLSPEIRNHIYSYLCADNVYMIGVHGCLVAWLSKMDDPNTRTSIRNLFAFSQSCKQAYSETACLPVKLARLFSFECAAALSIFVEIANIDMLKKIHTIRVGRRTLFTLWGFCHLDRTCWQKLVGLRRIELSVDEVGDVDKDRICDRIRVGGGLPLVEIECVRSNDRLDVL